jgi:predicted nucleic acid-binding protein
MKRSVYIETTIPSFYHEVRAEPVMIARREGTQRWWTAEARRYDLFTSAIVLAELEEGDYPGKEEAIRLVADLPLLDVVPEIERIVQAYAARQLMPRADLGDAYHLAIASYYGMDFLLTWNCRHLANANKVQHLRVVNTELGLAVPIVTTPDLLLTETDDDS